MRKALLALLVIPVMTLMAGGIEPANEQPEDRRRATTHAAYKSHHRWGYTYMDWCKREAFPLNEQEGKDADANQQNACVFGRHKNTSRTSRTDDAMREERPVRQRRACQSCPEWLNA